MSRLLRILCLCGPKLWTWPTCESSEDLARALSSDHDQAESWLLELARISIDRKKTAGDEDATTTSKPEVELRAEMDGFELHFSAWPTLHGTHEGTQKKRSTEFGEYSGARQLRKTPSALACRRNTSVKSLRNEKKRPNILGTLTFRNTPSATWSAA